MNIYFVKIKPPYSLYCSLTFIDVKKKTYENAIKERLQWEWEYGMPST